MTQAAVFYSGIGRVFRPYEGFVNDYSNGGAQIARLVGGDVSSTLGCGIARYHRVKTTWVLPFDEIIHVLEGSMTVRFGEQSWEVVPGDVLFFPRLQPVEYDVPGSVAVFYAKFPV
jgi:ethanolamine utilization protein EutQ